MATASNPPLPQRGARFFLLKRDLEAHNERFEYGPVLSVSGPTTQQKAGGFKLAYGLIHASIVQCEEAATLAAGEEFARLGAAAALHGMHSDKLIGPRTHHFLRRNGMSCYVRFAVEDAFMACLSVPRLPVAEWGVMLLDALLIEGYLSEKVMDPDFRDEPPTTISITQALANENSKAALEARYAAALAWIEGALYCGLPADVLPSTFTGPARSVMRFLSRWGPAPPTPKSAYHLTDEQAALTQAARHWLLHAACLHRPLEESVATYSVADGAPRWSLLGGAVYDDGVSVVSNFPSHQLAKLVAIVALRNGLMEGEHSPTASTRHVSTGPAGASRLMRFDVSALLAQLRNDEDLAMRSAERLGGHPYAKEPTDLMIQPFHPPSQRAILLLAGRRGMAMACLYVPSVQPYLGTHIGHAEDVLKQAVAHMATAVESSRTSPIAPSRLLADVTARGSPLERLLREHGLRVLAAAAVSPARDLKWFELADPAAFLDNTLQVLVASRKANLPPEETVKHATRALQPEEFDHQSIVALLHNTAVESIRAAYRAADPMQVTTTVLTLNPCGPLSAGVRDEALDELIAGSDKRRKKVMDYHRHLSRLAVATECNTRADALTGDGVYALAVLTQPPREIEPGSSDEVIEAFSCLIRLPPKTSTENVLRLGGAAVRGLRAV
jgi:hypothetical protein